MSLSDLAALGSFVSGIAVLASLVFLFIQMRYMTKQLEQSERNQRALMVQGAATRGVERANFLAEPHICAVWARVVAGEADFSAEEIVQLQSIVRSFVLGGHDVYLQYRDGLADLTILENVRTGLVTIFAYPACRAIWQMSRTQFNAEWSRYIDQVVADATASGPRDIVAQFRAALDAG